MDRKDVDTGISAVAMEKIDEDYQHVVRELSANEDLERFKLEYEKLHRALRKSHEAEKRLIKKCQELNQEIASNAHKIQAALQLSQEDESTIASLRKEIEKAWKMVDAANDKEAKAKDNIAALSQEVGRLHSLIEQGAGLSLGHESNLQDLLDEKKALLRDKDVMQSNSLRLQAEAKELHDKHRRLASELELTVIDLTAKRAQFDELCREHEAAQRKRDANERSAQDYHQSIEKRVQELENARETLAARKAEFERLEHEERETRDRSQDMSRRAADAQQSLDSLLKALREGEIQKGAAQLEIPRLQNELDKRHRESEQLEGRCTVLSEAIRSFTVDIDKVTRDRETILEAVAEEARQAKGLAQEVEGQRKMLEDLERKVKDKAREMNITITRRAREENERVRLEGQRTIEIGKNRSMAQEVDAHLKSNESMRKDIFAIEQQHHVYREHAAEAAVKLQKVQQEVRQHLEEESQLRTELEEILRKQKQQQTLYEQVRSDRALYKKNLNDAEAEIEEMQRKFRLMDHQIDQLKDELVMKEKQLCQAHVTQRQLAKDISSTEQHINHLQEDYSHAKGRGDALAEEIKQLTQIITECDAERVKRRMKYNSATNERNILAAQLIRRSEELTLLHEKLRVQQSTLSKGEAQYRERLVDIRMLREKAFELRTCLGVAVERVRNIGTLDSQAGTLERLIVTERTKVKALYDELQTPMNVHRWRNLEGSNPIMLETIMKLHTLQKRLVAKSDECKKKDQLLQVKDREYTQLKNVLSRQPGPEIAEQLHVFTEHVKKRSGQLKSMDDELAEAQLEVTEQRDAASKLREELALLKKRYFSLKSSHLLLQRERKLSHSSQQATPFTEPQRYPLRHPPSQPRFAGGGFSVSR